MIPLPRCGYGRSQMTSAATKEGVAAFVVSGGHGSVQFDPVDGSLNSVAADEACSRPAHHNTGTEPRRTASGLPDQTPKDALLQQ